MDKKVVAAYGLVCLLIVSVLFNVVLLVGKSSHSGQIKTSDTTRVTIIDTIPYLHPVPKDSIVVRYETRLLPTKRDTTMQTDCIDSVKVEIPITQKRYADSTYTAWVSGYNPTLDSIRIYPRHEAITITNTIRQKPKRWGVGLNVGYGFTPKNGMQPYVGIGVSYNLFTF